LSLWRSDTSPNEDQRPLAKRPTPKNKLTDYAKNNSVMMVDPSGYLSFPFTREGNKIKKFK